ncbi:MAG: hypothetical protein WC468_03535 [Candidatus Paceibacterota bacterium]
MWFIKNLVYIIVAAVAVAMALMLNSLYGYSIAASLVFATALAKISHISALIVVVIVGAVFFFFSPLVSVIAGLVIVFSIVLDPTLSWGQRKVNSYFGVI